MRSWHCLPPPASAEAGEKQGRHNCIPVCNRKATELTGLHHYFSSALERIICKQMPYMNKS